MPKLKISRFRRWWRPAACAAAVFALLTAAVPEARAQGGGSWIAIDAHSTHVLVEQNSRARRSVDGFARLATALVTLDWASRTGTDMGRAVVVPGEAARAPLNPMALQPGDRLSFRDLVYSVMLGADDAAAVTLAATVGRDLLMRRQRGGDPAAEFVREMNHLARQEGLRRTTFRSPTGSGLGGRGDAGNTTTADLALLARYAMSRPALRFYSMQPERSITISRVTGGSSSFRIRNNNPYAGRGDIDGVMALSGGKGGPAAILTSKRGPEVRQLGNGSTQLYPRRVIVVCSGVTDPPGVAARLLGSGWGAFDAWTTQGRPMEPSRLLLQAR